MATFAIESNGRIENTAVYFNGEQIGGVKEIFVNIDEDGTFDSVLQYEGTDKKIYSKDIFNDFLENVRITEPSFTDEEAENLQNITIESNGDLENTEVFINGEFAEGIINLMIHIKGVENKTGLKAMFGKSHIPERAEFKAEITFRNDDDSIDVEDIF